MGEAIGQENLKSECNFSIPKEDTIKSAYEQTTYVFRSPPFIIQESG